MIEIPDDDRWDNVIVEMSDAFACVHAVSHEDGVVSVSEPR